MFMMFVIRVIKYFR